jgi:hypothetical protein
MNAVTTKALLWTTLAASVVVILYGVYYTQKNVANKVAAKVTQNPGFHFHHLSADLSSGVKNAEIEKDIQIVQADIDQMRLLYRQSFTSQGQLSQAVAQQTRLSPEDKQWLQKQITQNPSTNGVEFGRALVLVYLNASLIDRQTTLSDKLLPRHQAVPTDAGQYKTVGSMYATIRENLNKMRNMNSDSYFELMYGDNQSLGKAQASNETVMQLSQDNQDTISDIIPLIRAFELP